MTEYSVNFKNATRSAQVNADSFRQMVNYDNTRNKGYVRMSLGSDGKVHLQKINNKLDVPLCFRSNVNAANNKQMRELFSKVMSNDLKYMDPYFKSKILNMIASPKNGATAADSSKVLSRLDIRDIFEKFDQQFNTADGRQAIIRHFMEQARTELGLGPEVSQEDFENKYLMLSKHGMGSISEYYTLKEGTIKRDVQECGTKKINIHEQMVKTEDEFRTLIASLEGRLTVAKHYASLTNTLKNIAQRRLDNTKDVPIKLTANEEADLRGPLKAIANEEGFADLDGNINGTIGTSGGITELFLKHVMPVFLRQGAINVYNVGGQKNSDNYKQVMDDNFGIDAIMKHYRDFLSGARDAINQSQDIKVTDNMSAISAALQNAASGALSTAIMLNVRRNLYEHAKIDFKEAQRIGQQVGNMSEVFKAETKLNKFTIKYIHDNFAKQEKYIDLTEKNASQAVKDYTDKLVTAAQIQFGARQMFDKKTARSYDSAAQFIEKMCTNLLPKAANSIKGGWYVYTKLFEKTMPAYMNQVIDEATRDDLLGKEVIFTDKTGRDIHKKAYATVEKKLECLVKSFEAFNKNKLDGLFSNSVSSYEKHLLALAKRHKLEDYVKQPLLELKNTFEQRLHEGVEQLMDKFFSQSMSWDVSEPEQLQKQKVDELVADFNILRENTVAEINVLANEQLLAHLPGNREVKNLADVKKKVTEYMNSHTELATNFGLEVKGTLERIYSRTFADMLTNTKTKEGKFPPDFATKFNAEFDKKIKEFSDGYNKFSTEFSTKLRSMLLETTRNNLDPKVTFGMLELKKYSVLSPADRETMAQSLTNDLILGLDTKTSQIKKDFIQNPEKYKKYNMKQLIENKIVNDASSDGLCSVLVNTLGQREHAVQIWTGTDKNEAPGNVQQNVADNGVNKAAQYRENLSNDIYLLFGQLDLHSGSQLRSYEFEEMNNLSTPIFNAQLEKITKFPYLYGRAYHDVHNKTAFNKQVTAEYTAEAKKAFALYDPFRQKYLQRANELIVKYEALTQEFLEKMINTKLDIFSKDIQHLPNVDEAIEQLDNEMRTTEEEIIQKRLAEAKAAKEKRTAAYNNTMSAFTRMFEQSEAKFREAGATDDDILFLKRELMPAIRDKFSCKINLSPEDYLEEGGVKKAEQDADTIIENITYYLEHSDLSQDDTLLELAKDNGFKNFLKNSDTKELVLNTLHTWLKSDEGQELQKQHRKAQMTYAVYGTTRGMEHNIRLAIESEDALRESIRKNLLGFLTERSVSKMNQQDLPMAHQLFNGWLDQFNLPEIKISITGQGDITFRDYANTMFNQRIKNMMDTWTEKPNAKLQVLDQNFIMEFLNQVNTMGLETMLGVMSEQFENDKLKQFTTSPENQLIFRSNANDMAKMQNIHSDDRNAVMLVNYRQLVKCIQTQTSNASADIRKQFSTVEGLTRWKETIANIYENEFTKNIDEVMRICKSRITMLEQLPNIEKNINTLFEEAFNEFFGTDLNSFIFSKKFDSLGISPRRMQTALQAEFMSSDATKKSLFETFQKNMTNAAQEIASGYSTTEATFPTDPPKGRGGVKRLSNAFKELIKAEIRNTSLNTKGQYAKCIELMQTEIKAKTQQEVARIEKIKAELTRKANAEMQKANQ